MFTDDFENENENSRIERFLRQEDMQDREYFEEGTSVIEIAGLDLANSDLNQHLVMSIIKMLRQSFWWRFRSLESQLLAIEKTFTRLHKMVQFRAEDEEELEEQDADI